jgi:hypothetical protein
MRVFLGSYAAYVYCKYMHALGQLYEGVLGSYAASGVL